MSKLRFPYVASELLSSQNEELLDFLFPSSKPKSVTGSVDSKKESEGEQEEVEEEEISRKEILSKEMLDYLFSIFDSLDTINHTSLGYFSKIFISIINRKGEELLNYLFYTNPKFLETLFLNYHFNAVSEIIEKIVELDFDDKQNFFIVISMLIVE